MNCEQFQKNVVACLRGELSAKEKAEMDEHISWAGGKCTKCGRELAKAEKVLRVTAATDDEAAMRVVHTYIVLAIKRNASDLHFELRRGGMLTVRCRADGVMVDLAPDVREMVMQYPEDRALVDDVDRTAGHAIVARLKYMSDVDPAETDNPQTGRIRIRWEDREFVFVGSFMPTADGEDAVFRIVPKSAPMTLDSAGVSEQSRAAFERMLSRPMGLVLVGGPAGSGKTTVVLSLAQHQAAPHKKTVTIEDPIFSTMENVTQLEVAEHRGLTTSALLSRVLRLDPDIVAVHLIDNAQDAVKCAGLAMEGRLVMSAFHASDAAAAVSAFAELLGDRSLAASSMMGATNQRLVRTICPDCRERYTPSSQALKSLYLDSSSMDYEHGAGCEKCHNTGFRGRTVIVEALEMTTELADLLLAGADPVLVRSRLLEATSPTLVEDGRRKVAEGVTTAEEVCRVIPLPR